ncbi:Ig-like domain-containing protein [Pelotomaculum sp. PtaB.Bin117]|uniref:Ig-like domain-containing protein n=1 Tax=Pelotomaculum sp. PtaB.Bin117 TaxID=1811694 RepID=UPI00257AC588|nr:Ig-like domain-containing protein [Pelotomaculum sp. PtaB.Bin117]
MAADTLTIKVGYFGGPYYTKKVYTLSDLDALPQVRQAYTFIDSLPAVCVDAATGVKLTDLLEDAGIDVNSAQKFYFFSTDVKKGWYQCLDKSFLLDTPRFYYPNLPAGWDYETASSTPEAVYGAVRVEPLIAYKDNWQRFDAAPDFSTYDTSTRFRLLFGQSDADEHTAPQSVKWVHAIEVMLGGTPPAGVTLDRDMVNLKVGSMVRLKATVAPDEATDKTVRWSSSDTGVATVDKNGLVTVVGEGTATITVTTVVGNLTAACVVNGPDQDTGGQGIASNDAGETRGTPPGPPESARRYLAEKDAAVAVSMAAAPEQSGYQPWRVFEMSADAVPLRRQEQSKAGIYGAVLFIILFLFGLVRRYKEYLREIAT